MNNMDLPMVTVVIATYNSYKILPRTLEALRNQNYPQDKIEILMIDGGSTDLTRKLATQYNCKVLENPKMDPGEAKMIGVKNAKGRYLITLDHDEVLSNPDSIIGKVEALMSNPECKVAFCSGYERPKDYPGLNEYISEYGDPFSLFYYRFSKHYRYFVKAMRKVSSSQVEQVNYWRFQITGDKQDKMIIELACLATMIDLDFFRNDIDITGSRYNLSHAFYLMVEKGYNNVVVLKNDHIVHYSVDSIKAYLPKLRFRVVNQVHNSDIADIGFEGRIKASHGGKIKKYAFVPYTISCIFPILDSFFMALTRKNAAYLLHVYFCWYVFIQIIFNYILKISGRSPVYMNYSGDKKVG